MSNETPIKMTQAQIKKEWENQYPLFKVGTLRYFIKNDKTQKIDKPTADFASIAYVKECFTNADKTFSDKLFYDADNGNIHFAPKEPDTIFNALPTIEKTKANGKTSYKHLKFNEIIASLPDNMKIKRPFRKDPLPLAGGTDWGDYAQLFQCYHFPVQSETGTRYYDLMLFRCAKKAHATAHAGICCDLGAVQMLRSDRKDIYSITYYPDLLDSDATVPPVDETFTPTYYNPPLTIYDNAKDIADAFADFVDTSEAQWAAKQIQIIQNNILPQTAGDYLLRLDRALSRLMVYKKITPPATCENIDQFYREQLAPSILIRDNFSFDNYTLFKRSKVCPCLFGSDEKSTPFGSLAISKVSPEKYISGYYASGKVSFFGYLEIFEDYFIHSHLYAEDATAEAKGESVSLHDTHTSGCIRVSEDDLAFLLDNITKGTPIYL